MVKKVVKKKTASVSAVKKAVKKKAASVSAAKRVVKAKKKPKSDKERGAWLCYMRADGVHVIVPLDGDYSLVPPKGLWPDGDFQWPPPPDKRGNLDASDSIMAVMK